MARIKLERQEKSLTDKKLKEKKEVRLNGKREDLAFGRKEPKVERL